MKRIFGLTSLVMLFLVTVSVSFVSGEDVTIGKGKKVKFDYTLKIDNELVETSEGKEPLEYTHGEGQIIPGLASALNGLKVGDEKTVVIEPKDAYGEIIEEAMKELPKSSFPEEFEPQQGMVIELKNEEGESAPGIIWEIKDAGIVVNFNHPLAGKTLEFDIKIVEIK